MNVDDLVIYQSSRLAVIVQVLPDDEYLVRFRDDGKYMIVSGNCLTLLLDLA